MQKEEILVIGALGQLGSELTKALAEIYGQDHLVITDIRQPQEIGLEAQDYRFESLNVLDAKGLANIVDKYKITQIYHLAAVLSASGEQDPLFAWQINTDGTLNVLEVAREKGIRKLYFPSSIAVFGSLTPRVNTPQETVMNPSTVYGISKQTCERWCEYYFQKFGLDVRSLRYPGIISHQTLPGGGTTDYAVEIFYEALRKQSFTCFLEEDSYLPMIYMPDAIRATLELMEADTANIQVRSSYNLASLSFSPSELAEEIRREIPNFKIQYQPDFRQKIANSWPQSIDDSSARKDWNWQAEYDLPAMTQDMLKHLRVKLLSKA